ncbi:DUF4241 domain-containing protein [Amycolatopsis sp. EV170708-02-1]|uniref:DUF4241 domain-containing protein n=1 Tax=Amycolatopsis sp. EV170708-02-1 TaxID=2919322 RepID=UPI001F0BAA57|nr:DUF4241 domain-containing protein [Amycolatopsis sp. EV170708-02-1]UMP06867.1 DUF4241 domain-containing protein [Amycolatopsis sp. EV170708-02-1]
MKKIIEGVLVPLPAPDFERLFAPGTRHTLPHGDVATVRLLQDASLWLPSGRVVAGEPCGFDDADDGFFVQQVSPGEYPLLLVIAMFAKRNQSTAHEMIAAARLVIRDEPVASWEMAACEGDDVFDLGDDEYFGYPVDGGVGGFVDAANIATLRASDDYSDQLLSNLDIHVIHETDRTAPATLADDEGRPLVVAFSSGNGDGHYPTWVGRTADGEVACFLTDFLILTDNGDDELPSGDTDGSPLSDLAQEHEVRAR